MTDLQLFLKPNKIQIPNRFYAPTRSLCDEKGAPIKWEFRHVTTKESEAIRIECTRSVPIGKYGQYRQELDSDKYMSKLIVKAVVYPDLHNKELQDSYGVMTPEELLKELIDDPAEYNALVSFISQYNGGVDINEKVKEAKN